MTDGTAGTGETGKTYTAEKARTSWTDVVSDAQYGGKHVTITRNGKRAVMVVPADWYDRAVAALEAQAHAAPDTSRPPRKRA